MKVKYLENGSLIVTQGSKSIFVILGIMTFLFFARDAFLWVFTEENVYGSRVLAVFIIMLTVLLFYRVFSLSSKFLFSTDEKSLKYNVQYTFSNKKGSTPITSVEKAVLETDSEGMSRIVIVCDGEKIPMSTTVESSGMHDSVCIEINKWLDKNA